MFVHQPEYTARTSGTTRSRAARPVPLLRQGYTFAMPRWKIIAIAILTLLLAVLVFQNTEPVETRFLLATVTMPGALLIFTAGAAGFVIGLLTALRMSAKKKPSQE